MCTYIPRDLEKSLSPKMAEEDISCFKVVLVNEGNIYSVIRKFPYRLKKLYTEEGDFSTIYYSGYFYYHIEGGGFHSFADIRSAIENLENRENFERDKGKVVIVQCHIPKGSLYYTGESLVGRFIYVSQSIVIDEIIK